MRQHQSMQSNTSAQERDLGCHIRDGHIGAKTGTSLFVWETSIRIRLLKKNQRKKEENQRKNQGRRN